MQRGEGPDDPRVSHGICPACEAAPESYRDKLVAMWDRLSFAYEPQFGIERDVVDVDLLLVKNSRAS